MALTDKNLYAYCDNNPVMHTDPSGESWLGAIIGASVNLAVTFFATVFTGQEYTFGDAITAVIAGGIAGGVSAQYAMIGGQNKPPVLLGER